jgi:hypothetical protein
MALHRLIGDVRRLDWEYCSTMSRAERLTATPNHAMQPQEAYYIRPTHLDLIF